MTDPTVVPFVPRLGRSGPLCRVSGAGGATAAERTGGHLTRIEALLGMPMGAFFDEVPCRGATIPDPREVLELIDVFRRIGSVGERRHVLDVARSALRSNKGGSDL